MLIVFNDPDRLRLLEQIIHPRVAERIVERVQRSQQPVIVIEPAKQNAAVMERERVGEMIHFDGAVRAKSRHATVAKINVAAGVRARAEEFATKNTLVGG